MSYLIEIYAAALSDDNQQALAQAEQIKHVYSEEQGKIDPNLRKLYAQLVKVYPCQSSYSEYDEGREDCPWSDSPLINNFGAQMAMLDMDSQHEEVLAHILVCAGKLQLSVIDPQEGVLYHPNSELTVKFIQHQKQLAAQSQPWNEKTVKNAILSYMEPMLEKHGFVFKKSKSKFERIISGGYQGITFVTYNYSPKYCFSFVVGVRLDELEALSEKIYAIDAVHGTLQANMDDFTKTKIKPAVRNFDELTMALHDLGILVEEKVLPFLEQCKYIDGVDKELNPVNLPGRDTAPNVESRALMVAWLANNPDFPKLVNYYRDSVKAYYQEYRDNLEQTISYLLQHKNEKKNKVSQE
ncbi:hypothetical protein [Undibacterium sp.]|uniref:hypothetical protein n=1 Tax=Undibacterium sp. TaxID=1914977 RepID=UPI00273041C1|nr:hypothetical protein [Undibacterium sp.]MDP1977204.1 hypothetical protein [Undibacterium sp.]